VFFEALEAPVQQVVCGRQVTQLPLLTSRSPKTTTCRISFFLNHATFSPTLHNRWCQSYRAGSSKSPATNAPSSWWDMTKDDLSHQLRSASPAIKRPASDMGAQDREDHNTDVEMDDPKPIFTPINPDAQTHSDSKAKQQDTGATHGARDGRQIPHISHPGAISQEAPSDSTRTSLSDSLLQTPSIRSTAATSINMDIQPSAEPPSIDEQVAKVMIYLNKEIVDKQKGYVISQKWLTRVHARSSEPPKGADKNATEGDIGPIDNADIAMVTEDSGKLLDQAGEKFVSLRPGLRMSEDYQILPQEAWDLVVSWYGLAKDSPVITRYAYDIASQDALQKDVQFELNPPIFSLLKVPCESTAQTQRESNDPPVRWLSSKYMSANEWMKKCKDALNIDMATKVRVWRILGGLKNSNASGMLTPAASRSASPAPGAEIVASAGDRMLLDVNTFAALALGEHREKLEMNDNTNNAKFDGKSTLDTFSLGGRNDVLAFEEQKGGPAGGEWPSEHARIAKPKGLRDKIAGVASSGRTSPAPGVTTRGRSRQNGRPRGIIGLSNLGNTCYMNSALQSLRSVEELTQYFLHEQWKHDLNPDNPLGHRGEVAKAYAALIKQVYDETGSSTWPGNFKKAISKYGSQFSGYQQQDSQEFLLFLLDGLQEDLNRIDKKPYIEKPDSTDEMVHDPQALKDFADRNWDIYKARNDSVVTDLFAGMYKSTLTCPVCDKVSIIFDPFSNLTLQLPIENNWSKEVVYVPFGKRPIRMDVEIDKNASIRALKEFVAKRTGSQVENLVVSESYKNKFYKVFDNPLVLSEAGIQNSDVIMAYELESIPTNYNPDKQPPKQQLYMPLNKHSEDEEVDATSPGADRLMIPLFHRLVKNPTGRVASKPFFGLPTYIVLDRRQNSTYEGVLRRILISVASMSSKSLFDKTDFERDLSPENSDTVIMTDDGSASGPLAASEVGEDGYVDIKMNDSSDTKIDDELPTTKAQKYLGSGKPLPEQLFNLFDICVATTGESIPTGWNGITESTDLDSIKDRIPTVLPDRSRKDGSSSSDADSGSATSEAEGPDVEYAETTPESVESAPESDTSEPLPSMEDEAPEVNMFKSKGRNKHKKVKSYKGKNRTFIGKQKPQPRQVQKQPTPPAQGFVRPGEAIVLDWNNDAFDALFGGDEDDQDEMRGGPTWKGVPILPDEELSAKRAERTRRRKNGISLEECLNEFGKSETLSEQNAWYCPRCKEHRRAEKKFELWKAPDVLVMHLKRFSSNRNFRDKLEVRVDYPIEGLDLTKMVQDSEGKSMVYDLIAVDNHYGGLGGGHYTAYAKHSGNGNWYEYNGKPCRSRDLGSD
jgi:ubiquitin carboxyl-terminal hydrolase 4/11